MIRTTIIHEYCVHKTDYFCLVFSIFNFTVNPLKKPPRQFSEEKPCYRKIRDNFCGLLSFCFHWNSFQNVNIVFELHSQLLK